MPRRGSATAFVLTSPTKMLSACGRRNARASVRDNDESEGTGHRSANRAMERGEGEGGGRRGRGRTLTSRSISPIPFTPSPLHPETRTPGNPKTLEASTRNPQTSTLNHSTRIDT
eukprot:954779-Rhodomonas_salina.1